jgi:molecular chaperone GrpE
MVEDKEPKPANLEENLENEKKRSDDYLTRLKYLQADFENFKKRFDREVEQTKSYCNERIIFQLLEVIDELELAVKNAEISTESTQSLLEGVEMTLKKLRKVLEQEGVSEIENPEGKIFDPSKHNAVLAVETDDATDGTVLEQIRKGYIMRGKVLRPSIVKVAVKKSQNQNNQNGGKKIDE